MSKTTTSTTITAKITPAARARLRHDHVVQQAGADGHIVHEVPRHELRTDLVDPVLAFVVYGNPAPQGSKRAFVRGGKAQMKESSDALAPWRTAVRTMSRKATADWAKRHGRPWEPLDEPVMVSPTITMPATQAATKSGAVYHMGTPDLDKLQRALGDSLAPVPLKPSDGAGLGAAAKEKVRREMRAQRAAASVLVDDSRIAAWGEPLKIYPSTIPTSLGYAGTLIQVWRLADLESVSRRPVVRVGEVERAAAGDLRSWARPDTGQTWDELSSELWGDPEAVFAAQGRPVELLGRAISADGARTVLAAMALHGPQHQVAIEAAGR